jgi:hypothetical protein
MPHSSLKLLPGVDQNKTPTLNEAAISTGQLIRFIPDRTLGGLVQQVGGWTRYPTQSSAVSMRSIVRALLAWEDTNNNSYLGVGSEGVAAGGGWSLQNIKKTGSTGAFSPTDDISPEILTVPSTAVSVATTYGSNSVLITDTGRGITGNDTVWIKTPISVGGLVLFGQYQCYDYGSSIDQYIIYATDPATGDAVYASLPAAITATSGTGTVATLTYNGPYQFVVGETVVVAGLTGGAAGYNDSYTVTASAPGSVSYANATTSAISGSGTVNDVASVPYFTTTNTQNTVLVTFNDHGYFAGDTFPILVSTAVGGITLFGNYIVSSVVSARQFTFRATETATSTASVYENGGSAYYLYYKGTSPPIAGIGYGIGTYGGTSPVSGYGGTITGAVPATPAGTPINAIDWTLDNWGEVLIACPLQGTAASPAGGAIYQWSPTSGLPNAYVIPEAPPVNEGCFIAMPQRQIVAWGSTFNGIQDPLLIRWCDVENYNSWIQTQTNQAGYYRLPKGSKIIQCIQGPQQGLIWTDLGCWAMQYVGPPYVYQFNEVGTGCGLIGRKAAASVNGVVYWMGPSQFYRLSGNGVEPIRCPVWDVVFQDLDTTNLDRIRIAPNSRFGEITWYYPTIGNGGENDGYVKYNYVLDQWDYGANSAANPYVARSAWINESVLGPPIGAGLNQYLFQHETSQNADGAAMDSYFQTGYFALTEADVLMFIDQLWPDMKWGFYGMDQGANILLTFYVTSYPNETPLAYGPYLLTSATKYITPRFRGRLVSIKIESNALNSWWRLGNIRYRVQQDGKFL